jgi:hypothetical protein
MATFYKYAERTAESQVNWAEIGKDMTDMLRQEVAVREEKKAAIDEATRRYAEELSNAPQGEHEPGSTEALRFADQATKYMLQQEKLLKSGLLDPRDYMIARQNLTDGTKQAFNSMKAFQANYAELMERAKTDKSSLLEIQNLEEIQGYGNFRQSGFFIDSPTGRVNVGLKEEQDIDGQKVMGLKKGSTRGMQYIQGGIFGRIDKFKYQESVDDIVARLGVEIQQTLDPATMSKLGSVRSDEDLRLRKDIDPVTDKPLFDFYTSIRDSAKASVANPLEIASLLVDTLGYKTTTDPAAAAKDPNLILKVTDPDTGRAEYKITDVAQKAGEDFLVQQILSGVTRKSTVDQGGQVQRQDEPEWKAAQRAGLKAADAAAGYWNQLYTGRTAAEKKAAADTLLGTPIAQEAGLLGIDLSQNGKIKLTYADPVKNRTIDYLDASGSPVSLRDFSGLGVELHGVVDRDKAVKAGGGGTGFGKVEDLTTVTSQRQGAATLPSATQVLIPTSAIEMSSTKAAASIQEALPANFTAKDLTPGALQGNQVKITAPNGKTFTINTKLKGDAAINVKGELEKFIKLNNVAKPKENEAAAASGTAGTVNYANK